MATGRAKALDGFVVGATVRSMEEKLLKVIWLFALWLLATRRLIVALKAL